MGACNSLGPTWKRAQYSAVGPGRSPGIVKPDIVAFGGDLETPYNVIDLVDNQIAGTLGTSFAAPTFYVQA